MGALCAKGGAEGGGEVDAKTKAIDASLAADSAALAKELKVLVLGTAESGKSSLLKQLRLCYAGGYSLDDRAALAPAVRAAAYNAMRTLIKAAERFDIQIKSKQNRGLASDFEAPASASLSVELAEAMQALWKDPGIAKAYSRRHELGSELSDSAGYLVQNAERFAQSDYVPTEGDVLRTRLPQSGIVSVGIDWRSFRLVAVDVAAQRSDKKRWIHYFEDVVAVAFVAALSHFDVLVTKSAASDGGSEATASTANALLEAEQLFHTVAKSDWFPHAQIMLFLNKRDLFKDKLAQGRQLTLAYPDYAGDHSDQDAFQFVADKFTKPIASTLKRPVLVFSLTATDQDVARDILKQLADTVVDQRPSHANKPL